MAKILLLYQFYAPDDVVSAIEFTQLGEGLAAKGHVVEAWPSNRSCHQEDAVYTTKPEILNGVKVRRVWRPGFHQHLFWGRILNALWVEASWKIRALFTMNKPEVVIIGTDPIFAIFLAPFFRIFWPRTKIAHWCFDLYPDYAVAESMVTEKGFIVRFLRFFLKRIYPSCDLIVDLGSCMRERLEQYTEVKRTPTAPLTLPSPATDSARLTVRGEGNNGLKQTAPSSRPSPQMVSHVEPIEGEGEKSKPVKGVWKGITTKAVTLTPWALEEPAQPMAFDPEERKLLFGGAKLGLLYSGNLSRPHRFDRTLELARKLKGTTGVPQAADPHFEAAASSGFQDQHNQTPHPGLRAGAQVVFAFSPRGNRTPELKAAIGPEDTHLHFAPFVSLDKLSARLSAPDIHIVSLRSAYTGVAVPSKFFGALAVGRPVLFEGDDTSAIARWIEEYKVGWVLNGKNLEVVAQQLIEFSNDAAAKEKMFSHCHEVYRVHFSKKFIVDEWDRQLKTMLV